MRIRSRRFKQRASEQGSPHPIAWWKEGDQLTYNPHVKVGGGTDPTKQEIRSGTAGTGGAEGASTRRWDIRMPCGTIPSSTAHHGCSVLAHGLACAQVVVAQPSCGGAVGSDYDPTRTDQHGNQPSASAAALDPFSTLVSAHRALLEICTLQERRRVVAGCIVVSYLHRSRAASLMLSLASL